MNEETIIHYLTTTFENLETVEDQGNTFFFYGSERYIPFATLVTNDAYDKVSDLNRPSVFRLNFNMGKSHFQSLFGDLNESEYDFKALNVIMPHPDYGKIYWVCVLNPSEETFETVKKYLEEAYEKVSQRHAKRTVQE